MSKRYLRLQIRLDLRTPAQNRQSNDINYTSAGLLLNISAYFDIVKTDIRDSQPSTDMAPEWITEVVAETDADLAFSNLRAAILESQKPILRTNFIFTLYAE